jgi:hypothetical protein
MPGICISLDVCSIVSGFLLLLHQSQAQLAAHSASWGCNLFLFRKIKGNFILTSARVLYRTIHFWDKLKLDNVLSTKPIRRHSPIFNENLHRRSFIVLLNYEEWTRNASTRRLWRLPVSRKIVFLFVKYFIIYAQPNRPVLLPSKSENTI